MAASAAKKSNEESKGSKGSVGQLVGALAVVTILAGGAGAFVSLRGPHASPSVSATPETAQLGQPEEKGQTPEGSALSVEQIPVVITNLKSPTDVWVRLETSMVFERKQNQNPEVVSGQLAADFLAYVRTLNLTDLESPDGLQNLRADLDDRAATRSNGAVKDILIRTLVFQ
jgi:flagellar protein FliL